MTSDELIKEMKKELHAAILQAIRDQPGIYGVPLRRAVSKALGRDVSTGSLYATLDVLEERGWVAKQDEPGGPERGSRAKACWHLRKAID